MNLFHIFAFIAGGCALVSIILKVMSFFAENPLFESIGFWFLIASLAALLPFVVSIVIFLIEMLIKKLRGK